MRYGAKLFRKEITYLFQGAPSIKLSPNPTRNSMPRWLSQSFWPCLISAKLGPLSYKSLLPRISPRLTTADFLSICLMAKSPFIRLIAQPSILAWPLWKLQKVSIERWLAWNLSICTWDRHHRRLLNRTRYPKKTKEMKRRSNRNNRSSQRMRGEHLRIPLVASHEKAG